MVSIMDDDLIDSKTPRFVGVDTHSDVHVFAAIDRDGVVIDTAEYTTDPEGILTASEWVVDHGPVRVGIEGSASYGAALAAALLAAGLAVVEVTRSNRQDRRNQGKSDHLDAVQAAQAARTRQRISPVKSHPLLHELRALYMFRVSALKARTEVGNQIQAMARIIGATPGKQSRTMMGRIATEFPYLAAPARRWIGLDDEAKQHKKQMTRWLQRHAPELLAQPYIGPVSATQLVLASGLNPERVSDEAAFARLCGLAPIPFS